MPEFKAEVAAREAKKAAELAPFIEAAMARKRWMQPLADADIPVVPASRVKAQINEAAASPPSPAEVIRAARDGR
jgi:hypothetical protein